jgi:hypothetical protein
MRGAVGRENERRRGDEVAGSVEAYLGILSTILPLGAAICLVNAVAVPLNLTEYLHLRTKLQATRAASID